MDIKKYGAEGFGTFWLVLGGCGSAVLAATFPNTGIGFLGVALAFGLTVLTMAFAIGHISGCHLNPAVSLGLWAGGRFPARELLPYIVAQVLGAIVAGGVLYLIASGTAGFSVSDGFAANGYGDHSPGGYNLTVGSDYGSGHDHGVSLRHYGRHGQTRAARLCADRNWVVPDSHPFGQHPGHEHLRESCTQHRCRGVCGRLGN